MVRYSTGDGERPTVKFERFVTDVPLQEVDIVTSTHAAPLPLPFLCTVYWWVLLAPTTERLLLFVQV
jgi:hypothetical protein